MAGHDIDRTHPRYRDYVEWVVAFDLAARERVQVHFDLNLLHIRNALVPQSGNHFFEGNTSQELRWLRDHWATPIPGLGPTTLASLTPKFWCDGRQTKPPWQWANPDRPEFL
jgi:hypothetical protein